VAPGFYIAESRPYPFFSEGDHGLAFPHFLLYVVRASFGDARTPGLGGRFHFVTDDPGEILVSGVGNNYLKLLIFHDSNMLLMINAPPLLQLLSQWPDRESRHAADKAGNTGTL
jgi:hypothetical protein